MRFPFEFALACAAAVAFVIAGRLFVQRPEQVYRAISFGKEPDRLGIRLLRGVGWFYIIGGAIAAVLFLIGTVTAILHPQQWKSGVFTKRQDQAASDASVDRSFVSGHGFTAC